MAENSIGFIFDSFWCYTIVICQTCLKNIKERLKTSRVYEFSGQPSYGVNEHTVESSVNLGFEINIASLSLENTKKKTKVACS